MTAQIPPEADYDPLDLLLKDFAKGTKKMDEIDQLKAVAFQKLAEARILPRENLYRVIHEDRAKFECFWCAFRRNVAVCLKNMGAGQEVLHDGQDTGEAPDKRTSRVLLRGALAISAGFILMCFKGRFGFGWFLLALILFLAGLFFPRGGD